MNRPLMIDVITKVYSGWGRFLWYFYYKYMYLVVAKD